MIDCPKRFGKDLSFCKLLLLLGLWSELVDCKKIYIYICSFLPFSSYGLKLKHLFEVVMPRNFLKIRFIRIF